MDIPKEAQEILDAAQKEKYEHQILAGQIMTMARDQMVNAMRFLDRALFKMPIIASDSVENFGVDGRSMYYNTEYVLKSFKSEKTSVTRAFLHMILHCIYHHPFRYEDLDRKCWDIACDLAVEQTILDLDLVDTKTDADKELKMILEGLKKKVTILTAERIYRFLLDDENELEKYADLSIKFFKDDHIVWISRAEGNANDRDGNTKTADTQTAMVGCHEADTPDENAKPDEEQLKEALVGKTKDDWNDVSEHAKIDLETFSKEKGFGAGSILLNLSETLKEKYDYTEFLKKFAVLGEEMKINDDEFDYIYYTYGLQLYENMPLVEPLEYRETKRIKEFAIAIDTSASCQGAIVERFLRKTYTILKSTESFFSHVNIHIIQCDSKIQMDTKVTNDNEFEDYMKNITLSGFGGTDFRPVFEYVNELIASHEFTDLKGLIYFTDGYGTFPERMPEYETAFVFIQDMVAEPSVPAWAVKLVLPAEDI